MHPHSYTADSLSQSQDLASAILSASSTAQIASACASIDAFLRSRAPDQSRHFYSLAFPALISKLFGFGDAPSPSPSPSCPGGWIAQSDDPKLASAIFSLLSPRGPLFQSIAAVDRHALVRYVFPPERLPEWARQMLSSGQVLNDLCPLFRARLRESPVKGSTSYQVQLNVFEYFVFWFAYYPICKGNNGNSASVAPEKPSGARFKLDNWMIPRFSGPKRGDSKLGCNLYLRLLYAYLREFVPLRDVHVHHQPYRSSLLHYGYEESDGLTLEQAEFFVDALVNYWLVGNDFSPLPARVAKCYLTVRLQPLRSVLGETPPAANLGEMVKLLVEYLNFCTVVRKEGKVLTETPRNSRVPSPGDVHLGGSWNLWIQRPVYRYILRTILFCPVGTSVKNISEVLSVWVSYMEPWKVGFDCFAELDALAQGSDKDANKGGENRKDRGYSSLWEEYVLSNYLFYTSLVVYFIGFAHKFLHTDPQVVLQMVLKIVDVLTSCKELVELLKKMDSTFHSKEASSSKSIVNSLAKYVPIIREQLHDWEDGLSETDADGSFLHEHWNKDLRLFSDGEDGGQQLCQLLIIRMEVELQAKTGNNPADNLQHLDSLKAKVSFLFGGNTVQSPRSIPLTGHQEHFRDEVFTPSKVRRNFALAEARYKGDSMKRPISDDEVEWLAKLLVKLSSRLNEALGLNQGVTYDTGRKWSYVEFSGDAGDVSGPKDTMNVLFFALRSWCLMLAATILNWMRMHGIKVNLRMLASKKIMFLIMMFAFFSTLKKAFRMVWGA